MWARMCSSYLLGSDVGPLWSQGWEETPISIGIGCEIRNFWKGWRKYAVGSPVPSDIETGIDLENLGKVGTQWLLFFIYLSLSYSYRRICWAPMSNFCQRRMWNSETWGKICIYHLSFTPLPLSVGTQWLVFFGSDVGPFWSQGLEGSSVSIGCEIRKLWKGWRKYASLFYSCTPICWVPRCGTMKVARLRRNFCQYRMWN